MGSLEPLQKATAGLRPASEGSWGAEESQILRHVENPSGISTNAAPISKAKNNRQSHGAQHRIFAPFSRRAPTHTPCPPGSPRGAAPRQSDCARRRNGPGAPREKTACRSKKIPAQTAPRPPGGAWGSPRPAPRARRAAHARLKGLPPHRRPSQVRLTLGPSTFNLFSTPTTTFNNHA